MAGHPAQSIGTRHSTVKRNSSRSTDRCSVSNTAHVTVSRFRWWLLTALVLAAASILVGWPLFELTVVASEQLPAGLASLPMRVLGNTVLVGASAAFIAATLGTCGAFLIERGAVRGRRALRVGMMLPVLVPPFVSAMSWLRAYGPSGLLDDVLGVSMPGLMGPLGVIAVISVNAAPLVYVIVVAALRSRAGRDLELAARASGGDRFTVLRTVTAPLLAPALLGSWALAFVMGINAFGAPAVLGTPARFETMTTRIYQDLALSARPEAFSRAILLATLLVAIALVMVVAAERSLDRVGSGDRTAGPTGTSHQTRPPRWGLTLVAWTFIAATTVIPLGALVLVALTKGVGLSPTPANWTLSHFGEALDGRLVAAMGRSLMLAMVAATVALLLGGAVATLRRRRFGRTAGVVVLMSFAVPGSTLAVAMLLAYGAVLRDGLLIILAAYVAKLWAVAHRSIAGSVDNLAPQIVDAARASGASPTTVATTVIVPVLRPALAGAWILVFLIAFHEVTMSSLLYGPGTDTLAVAILNLQQLGDVPVSSALAVILTVPALLATVPLLFVRKQTLVTR